MKYNLLALDIDGTLTNSQKKITPKTYQTLMEAQKKGLRLILASGRPTDGVRPRGNWRWKNTAVLSCRTMVHG